MTFTEEFEQSEGLEKALYAIAIAMTSVAYELKCLGNGNAATQMGAIEGLSVQIKEGLGRVADSISES